MGQIVTVARRPPTKPSEGIVRLAFRFSPLRGGTKACSLQLLFALLVIFGLGAFDCVCFFLLCVRQVIRLYNHDFYPGNSVCLARQMLTYPFLNPATLGDTCVIIPAIFGNNLIDNRFVLRQLCNITLVKTNPHPLYVGCAVIRQARVSEWKLMF